MEGGRELGVGGRGMREQGEGGERLCEGGREREWRKGNVDEGNERRSQGERGGMKRAEEGGARKGGSNGASEMGKKGSKGGREQWSKGGKLQGRYPKDDTAMTNIRYVYSAQNNPQHGPCT